MKILEKIIEKLHKNHFKYAFIGEKALLSKQYKTALKYYNKAIKYVKYDKNFAYQDLYYSSRAEIKRNLNDLKGALIDINKAIQISPTVYLYYFESYEIKKMLGGEEYESEAEKDLKIVFNILDKNGSSHVFQIYLAEKLMREGNLQKAIKLIDVENDSRYNTEQVLNLKLSIHNQLNDKENIIKDLNNLIEMFPLRVTYHEYKTNILFELSRYEEALTTCNKAIELDINNGKLYLIRLKINYNLKNYEQCLNDAETALSLVLNNFDRKECISYKSKITQKLAR